MHKKNLAKILLHAGIEWPGLPRLKQRKIGQIIPTGVVKMDVIIYKGHDKKMKKKTKKNLSYHDNLKIL